jgi:bifunctional DNase/RNase
MRRMKVKVVGLDQNTMVPVVVITDIDEKGFIPIMIGAAEANAINQGLEGLKLSRPMTHDLMKNILDALNVKTDRVVIYDLRDDTYFARIYLKSQQGEQEIDSRPSDALALALRTGCPIYVSEAVAQKALIANKALTTVDKASQKPIDEAEVEEFRRMLENLKPEDFERHLGR